jgi:hypothetical protein
MPKVPSAPVYILFRRPPKTTAEKILKKFPTYFRAEGEDLVFHSWLADQDSATEHLKWLLGVVQFERKFFRKLEAGGAAAVVAIRSHTRPLCIEPEALLLAHKLHLVTEIHFLTK